MPIVDEASTPNRLLISNRALVLCSICFFATFFGSSAITISFSIVLRSHAGSLAYWSFVASMLVVWFATLINMYRHAILAILADKPTGWESAAPPPTLRASVPSLETGACR
jgi:hypothetical protein